MTNRKIADVLVESLEKALIHFGGALGKKIVTMRWLQRHGPYLLGLALMNLVTVIGCLVCYIASLQGLTYQKPSEILLDLWRSLAILNALFGLPWLILTAKDAYVGRTRPQPRRDRDPHVHS
jgi:hypothetical protein